MQVRVWSGETGFLPTEYRREEGTTRRLAKFDAGVSPGLCRALQASRRRVGQAAEWRSVVCCRSSGWLLWRWHPDVVAAMGLVACGGWVWRLWVRVKQSTIHQAKKDRTKSQRKGHQHNDDTKLW